MVDQATRDKIKTTFPAFAWLLDVPEVGDLLAKAAQEGWDPARLQSQLYATNWWRSHAQTARNWDTLVATDPAEAARQRNIRRSEISSEVAQLGLGLKAWDVALIAEDSLRGGWDPTRITQRIVDTSRSKGLAGIAPTGTIRATMQDLRALGKQYAITLTAHTLGTWAMDIAAGKLTQEGARAQMVNLAKQRIDPHGVNKVMREALDSGQTVRDAYASVIQSVSHELEIDPSRIDLTDKSWSPLLDFSDAKGVQRPMNQTEAIQWARHQGAWQKTNSAKEAYAGLAQAMATRWGLRAS